ncbi:hypothetical protein FWG76_02935, partial [Candidatus Saccharibacteria bacterium]|nr:hypothetical protein [Candidatus Saccharibacteria bacterium]
HQMDNISESTFLEMANTKLRTSAGYNGPDFTTLDDLNTHLASVPNAQGFDQMSSLFSSAHAAGTANADVTKHWNTKMKDAIGL